MKKKLHLLLDEYFKGKISLNDQIELSEQLSNSNNREAEEILSNDWKLQLSNNDHLDHDLNPLLHEIHHKIRLKEDRDRLLQKWWLGFQRLAAILIIPLLITFLVYYYLESRKLTNPIAYAEIHCPLGVRTMFQLPDGSKGFLNSGSKLKYPIQFIGERNVDLTGEAYFDVVHDESSPFVVNTPNLEIKVLGTIFNIIANEREDVEEVILQSGSVGIFSPKGSHLTTLKPNEKLTLNINKHNFITNEVVASQYTSWKDGKLVFRNENMQQVAQRLSRWYNADVVVGDQELVNYSFHATFIDEPLDEVLKLLSITTPIKYKEEQRVNDDNGVFKKRKIWIGIDHSKIEKFK